MMRRRNLIGGLLAAPALAAPAVSGTVARAATGGRVTTGLEALIATGYRTLRGQRVGVITNPTGVLRDLRHEVDVMAADDRIDLVAVFGPEHGFRGTAQAGGSEGFFIDPKTRLPVYDTFEKTGDELAEIFRTAQVDTVLFDIQDVGPRFYTYVWTMFDSMVACAKAGKRVVVLDRPNPITARQPLGPVLDPAFATLIGREAIPLVHAMTVGELARLFNAEFLPKHAGHAVELDVVGMRGWRRDLSWEETGLPWVPPSPNMPTVDTAYVYPGTCLFSGTNISQGRGTTRPFEIVGAPYIDHRWAEALNDLRLPGVRCREAYFQPTFSLYQGKSCGGIQLYVEDRRRLDAVRLGIAVLATAKSLYPDGFAWSDVGTPGSPKYWIDNLTGSTWVRTALDAGKSIDEVINGWQTDLDRFRPVREKYLMYR
ncbi:DUF1343 domain-containing protein [Nonomuraea sp. NPDC050404]|uniref:exo-beta-N-acetylmuramidase NamZ family protein n=1 Tax=Nonomuraea sp. NPDC050404 TaxID=3155783 RepID=UPI0033DDB48A